MYDAYTFRNPTCDELTLYSQLAYNREIGQRLGVPTATYIQSMAWNGCNRPDAHAIRYRLYGVPCRRCQADLLLLLADPARQRRRDLRSRRDLY